MSIPSEAGGSLEMLKEGGAVVLALAGLGGALALFGAGAGLAAFATLDRRGRRGSWFRPRN